MRALLICPSCNLRRNFESLAGPQSALRLKKTLDAYPDGDVFRRMVKVWAPDVVFVSMEDAEAVRSLAQQMDAEFPTLQRVGLSEEETRETFQLALQTRMSGLMASPIDEDQFHTVLRQLEAHLSAHPAMMTGLGQIHAFVPVKGGVGASTIAANAARAFSREPGARVLLADFDMSSGLTGFAFKTEHNYSVNDAGERHHDLDEESWQRLIKRADDVDLLLSGAPLIGDGLAAAQIPPLLDYARRAYTVVAADLSDSFDERSLAVMREASNIFLVTTPELGALRLAKLKVLAMRRLDFEDKTKLLLNRAGRRMELSLSEIEETVGLPVYSTFPCEYAEVSKATRAAEASAKLRPSILQFLAKLGAAKPEKKRRFIERFAVVPARYSYR